MCIVIDFSADWGIAAAEVHHDSLLQCQRAIVQNASAKQNGLDKANTAAAAALFIDMQDSRATNRVAIGEQVERQRIVLCLALAAHPAPDCAFPQSRKFPVASGTGSAGPTTAVTNFSRVALKLPGQPVMSLSISLPFELMTPESPIALKAAGRSIHSFEMTMNRPSGPNRPATL